MLQPCRAIHQTNRPSDGRSKLSSPRTSTPSSARSKSSPWRRSATHRSLGCCLRSCSRAPPGGDGISALSPSRRSDRDDSSFSSQQRSEDASKAWFSSSAVVDSSGRSCATARPTRSSPTTRPGSGSARYRTRCSATSSNPSCGPNAHAFDERRPDRVPMPALSGSACLRFSRWRKDRVREIPGTSALRAAAPRLPHDPDE